MACISPRPAAVASLATRRLHPRRRLHASLEGKLECAILSGVQGVTLRATEQPIDTHNAAGKAFLEPAQARTL
jgi:hypothetical protein